MQTQSSIVSLGTTRRLFPHVDICIPSILDASLFFLLENRNTVPAWEYQRLYQNVSTGSICRGLRINSIFFHIPRLFRYLFYFVSGLRRSSTKPYGLGGAYTQSTRIGHTRVAPLYQYSYFKIRVIVTDRFCSTITSLRVDLQNSPEVQSNPHINLLSEDQPWQGNGILALHHYKAMLICCAHICCRITLEMEDIRSNDASNREWWE